MKSQDNQGGEALHVMRSASGCDDCFGADFDLRLSRAGACVPQVRWIGESYWDARPRIVIVLINPGAAKGSGQEEMQNEAALFGRFSDGGPYDEVRNYFREKIRNGDKWLCWYRDKLGIDLENVAHLNMAWCATQGNKYPVKMLDPCFKKHTLCLLKALAPDVVLLSGEKIHRFELPITEMLRGVCVIKTIHYASRKSRKTKSAEVQRVRSLLQGLHY